MGEGRQKRYKSDRDNNQISWRIMAQQEPLQVYWKAVAGKCVTASKYWLSCFTTFRWFDVKNIDCYVFEKEVVSWGEVVWSCIILYTLYVSHVSDSEENLISVSSSAASHHWSWFVISWVLFERIVMWTSALWSLFKSCKIILVSSLSKFISHFLKQEEAVRQRVMPK